MFSNKWLWTIIMHWGLFNLFFSQIGISIANPAYMKSISSDEARRHGNTCNMTHKSYDKWLPFDEEHLLTL